MAIPVGIPVVDLNRIILVCIATTLIIRMTPPIRIAVPTTESEPVSPPGWQHFIARRARILAVLCAVGLMLPWATSLLADSASRLAWAIDLCCHWQWIFWSGLVLSSLLAAIGNRRSILWLLALPLPWLTASPLALQGARTGEVFTLISANVHRDNTDPQPLIHWMAKIKPDVAVLLEVSPDYANGLGTLAAYPFQRLFPERGPFGMALLSRHPLIRVDVFHDADGIGHIEAQIQSPDRRIELIAFHPMPPFSPDYRTRRDNALRAFADQARASNRPTLIAGDFNATPWSSAFHGLAQRGLRRASGLAPTWPTAGLGLIGIPIDHVLVTAHWSPLSYERGPALGSDHYALWVRLALGRPPTDNRP
ncbi:MAG: endonuclease/exonuclease/phosphatase family protein [Gammaproteobacteria bacterium]|nr:endonuclease/exonuclease/phosphatase family protein [Gammaproteobacteria bacterium]MCP5424783.1 endonuclease/exonuclease/phosphatase family protein [Gammaproteobacteria bacterium]MCP5458240.1 endonuclease/exonuclease/phosphatase family protein [Gammaproteobacteria bacterium]